MSTLRCLPLMHWRMRSAATAAGRSRSFGPWCTGTSLWTRWRESPIVGTSIPVPPSLAATDSRCFTSTHGAFARGRSRSTSSPDRAASAADAADPARVWPPKSGSGYHQTPDQSRMSSLRAFNESMHEVLERLRGGGRRSGVWRGERRDCAQNRSAARSRTSLVPSLASLVCRVASSPASQPFLNLTACGSGVTHPLVSAPTRVRFRGLFDTAACRGGVPELPSGGPSTPVFDRDLLPPAVAHLSAGGDSPNLSTESGYSIP